MKAWSKNISLPGNSKLKLSRPVVSFFTRHGINYTNALSSFLSTLCITFTESIQPQKFFFASTFSFFLVYFYYSYSLCFFLLLYIHIDCFLSFSANTRGYFGTVSMKAFNFYLSIKIVILWICLFVFIFNFYDWKAF